MTIDQDYSQPLAPGCLPSTLVHLTFKKLSGNIGGGVLPLGLKSLSIYGHEKSSVLNKGDLPLGLEHLEIGPVGYFVDDQALQQSIPSGNRVFPSTLTSLSFGDEFDQVLVPGSLPSTIKYLDLGGYNSPIGVGDIPQSVLHLTLGDRYNKPINVGALPQGLIRLSFGNSFNCGLAPASLPSSLRYLSFGEYYNHEILPNTLPESLESLLFGRIFDINKIGIDTLPKSLQYLRLSRPINNDYLPTSIISITYVHSQQSYDNTFDLEHIQYLFSRGITVGFSSTLRSFHLRLMDHNTVLVCSQNILFNISLSSLDKFSRTKMYQKPPFQ
eukprot:gene3594-4117_t